MPTITWTLNKTCDNCGANVTFTSELGEKFKLSKADKLAELYKQAELWANSYRMVVDEATSIVLPPDLAPFLRTIREGTYPNRRTKVVVVHEPMFYYIKCPLCNERIYIC
jgi:hypothetical protein